MGLGSPVALGTLCAYLLTELCFSGWGKEKIFPLGILTQNQTCFCSELQMPVREHVMTAVAEGRKAVGKRLSKETISSSFPNYSYGSPCSMDGLSG